MTISETEVHHIVKIIRPYEPRTVIHKVVLQHLEIRDNDIILDVGSGLGEFIEAIKNPTVFKIGVDFDSECVEICKQYLPYNKYPNVHFGVADACKLPFQSNSFDVVTAICALEHVDNPTALIREAYRVCKKGGRGVFVTPNIGRPLRLVLAMQKKEKHERSGHKQGWDYHLLKDCVENNGWEVIRLVTRFVDFPLYPLLPKRLGRFMSYKILLNFFPRIGSELFAFCKKVKK